MKKARLVSLILFALCPCANAQNITTGEQARVQQTPAGFFSALTRLNTGKLIRYVTKEFLLPEDGAVWSTDTPAGEPAPLKTVRFGRTDQLDCIGTEERGGTARASCHNAADMTVNGQAATMRWLESAMLVK